MYEIIKIAFRACSSKLFGGNLFSFEIFGCDFMVDQNYNPFLLEVNTNPGLEESSPLIKKLVPRMIDDCLRITIDEIFITKYSSNCKNESTGKYISPYPVDNYLNSENLWHFLTNLKSIN